MQRQATRQHKQSEILNESSEHVSSFTPAPILQHSTQFQVKNSNKLNQQNAKNQLKSTEQNFHKVNHICQKTTEENNLHALHEKLNSETDKILKWKVSTELELAQKEKRLAETEEIMERQRKNLFELQMHSEQLSHRLQIELKNREQLSSKIDNTRKICAIVREHCNQLTSTLNLCVEEKENLKTVYSGQIKDIDNISQKCRSIETDFKNEVEQLEEMVREERNQRNKIIEEANAIHTVLHAKIEEMDEKIKFEFEKSCSLDQQLLQCLEKNNTLTNENAEIKSEISLCKDQVKELKDQMSVQTNKLEKDLAETFGLLNEEKSRHDALLKKFIEAQEQLLEMKTVKDKFASENELLIDSVKTLKAENEKNNEEIRKMSDVNASALQDKNELMLEIKNLERLHESWKVMQNDYNCIMEENKTLHKEVHEMQDKMHLLERNLKDSEGKINMFHDENEKLKEDKSSLKEKIDELNEKIRCANDLENKMMQSMSSLTEELKKERYQVESLQSKLNLNTSELVTLLEKSQSEMATKEAEAKKLMEDITNSNVLINELQEQQLSLSEQIKCLKEKNDSLNTSIAHEMEKVELLNNKMKLENENKNRLGKEFEEIKTNLKESLEIIEKTSTDKKILEELLAQMKEAHSEVIEERNDVQSKCLELEKEIQIVQSKSDSEIKEMVAVLEKYKRECDDKVSQKEAAILKLSEDLDDMEKKKQNVEEKLRIMKNENYSYQRKCADLEKEKDITEKTFQVKMMDLELQLTAKDKEMAEREVALLKHESNMHNLPDKLFNTPSRIKSPKVDERKGVLLTPKNHSTPTLSQLTGTPAFQPGSILKESNTPGINKKQVTFQEDTSDTDASSVDAMIIDNADLMTRLQAMERGVKMLTPMRVLPSPKNRRKFEQKKMDLKVKDIENNTDHLKKKARLNKKEDLNMELQCFKNGDDSDLKNFLRSKRQFEEAERNSGLDLDDLFEMIED